MKKIPLHNRSEAGSRSANVRSVTFTGNQHTTASYRAVYSFFPVYSCQFFHNQIFIPSTDVIQLTLTLMMTSAQVVQMCVTINDGAIQDYAHPDDHEKKILKTLARWEKENSTYMHHLHHNFIIFCIL